MGMKPFSSLRRLLLVAGLAFAITPGAASAATTSQAIAGTANPTLQSPVTFGGASLRIDFDTTYASLPTNQTLSRAVVHLDNDFVFDTTGLAQCSPALLPGTTTEQALAACPGSRVGGGTAVITGSSVALIGVLTAFNGTPSGGLPTLLLHVRFGPPGNATTVLVGSIGPSSRGGDFGSQIDIAVPDTAATGLTFTHLDFTLENFEPTPGHRYLATRCADADNLWNYAGDFTFRNGGGTFSPSAAQKCTTGLRGAALGKCKQRFKRKLKKLKRRGTVPRPAKKRLKKKLRRCRRAANALPE